MRIHQLNLRSVLSYLAMAAVVIVMASFLGGGRLAATSHFEQADTTVWYCAGQAVNAHADPYRVEPLRSCEIANEPDHQRTLPWVEPAPLPGYALAAFAGLAHLPFGLLRTLWFYLLVIAIVLSAFLLAKLARIPPLVALLCLGMVDGYFNLLYGELPPLAVAALVVAAWLGCARRYVAAAAVASIAMIEPHIGLPACLAMFVWWPRTRLAFGAIGTILAGLSIAALGLPANVEYFQRVLPVQAASEIAASDQYSLTRVLHILGFADKIALAAGSLSYLVMVGLGVAIARRVAAAAGSPGLIALLPPAVALLGGPYVHDLQMAAALPAAIILAASPRPALVLRLFALVAVAFPWHAWNLAGIRTQSGLLEIGAIVGAILVATWTRPVRVRVVSAFSGSILVIALACAIEAVPQNNVGPPAAAAAVKIRAGDLAPLAWTAQVVQDRSYSIPHARDVAEKVPVWLGLMAIVGIALSFARNKPPVEPVVVASTPSRPHVRRLAALRPMLFPDRSSRRTS